MAPKSQTAAEANFTILRQRLVDSGLNYQLYESRYSVRILLKKSLVKEWGHKVGDENSTVQTAHIDQDSLTQHLRHELEEARVKIIELENTKLHLDDRMRNSESSLGRAVARTQELEHAALETSERSQSLQEQLSKAREDLLAQAKQIGQNKVALEKQTEGLKLDISNKNAQLKVKNKKIKELEAQGAQDLENADKQLTESNRKVSALVAKNSAVQARLDEANKTIKLERSQVKSRRRKNNKAIQTDTVFGSLDTNKLD